MAMFMGGVDSVSSAASRTRKPKLSSDSEDMEEMRGTFISLMPHLVDGASRTSLPVPAYIQRLPKHKKVHAFVESGIFRWTVYAAIVANAIFLGVEVEHADEKSFMGRVCMNVDVFLTFVFALENILKFYAYGHEYIIHRMYPRVWNLLEVCTTIFGSMYVGMRTSGYSDVFTKSTLFLKMSRLCRLMRLCQLRQELMVIVEGFTFSIMSLFWVGIVCLVILYGSTVFCISAIGRNKNYPPGQPFDNKELFGGISTTMLTLFSILVLDEWSDVVRPIYKVQPLVVWFFVVFTVLMTFGMMNVVVGIIVETIALVRNKHRMHASLKRDKQDMSLFKDVLSAMKQHRRTRYSSLGVVDPGEVAFTEEEFVQFSEQPDIRDLINQFDFPDGFTTAEIFRMLNDKAFDRVHSDEFVTSMSRLISSNEFQNICLLHLGINSIKTLVRSEVQSLRKDLDRLHIEQLERLCQNTGGSHSKLQQNKAQQEQSNLFDEVPVKPRQPPPRSTPQQEENLSDEVLIESMQPPPNGTPEQQGNLLDEMSVKAMQSEGDSVRAMQPLPSTSPKQESNCSDEESVQARQPQTQVIHRKVHQKMNSKAPTSPRSLSRKKMSRSELLDPLRTATLAHCDEEVSKAEQAVELQDLMGRTPGLPGSYWESANPTFSREEEVFLVWAKLYEAIVDKDPSNIRRWVHHAENIGIEDSMLELERAYGERLAKTSRGAWASAQRVVNAIDRNDFDNASQLFVEACVARGAQKSTVLGGLTSLLQESVVFEVRNVHAI